MRSEERGAGSERNHTAPSLNPQSSTPDPAYMERVRWRCRRGLLELDIVLGRFIEQCYPGLDETQRVVFDALLDMPDTVLWDMIAGRHEAEQSGQQALLEKIRAV